MDDVRFSRGVRYTKNFRPPAQVEADESTILLLKFDGAGKWTDLARRPHRIRAHGKPQRLPEKR